MNFNVPSTAWSWGTYTLRYIRSILSTSKTTCLLNTSATVCGTLIATPVAGCLYGQAIRLTAVPFNGVVYHSQLDARNRSYPSTSALNDTLVGLRRSLAGVVRHSD